MYLHLGEHPKGVIIGTCDILDTDYSADNWEPGFANNLCYLAINCDTGQHSQCLPCLFKFASVSPVSLYPHWVAGWVGDSLELQTSSVGGRSTLLVSLTEDFPFLDDFPEYIFQTI